MFHSLKVNNIWRMYWNKYSLSFITSIMIIIIHRLFSVDGDEERSLYLNCVFTRKALTVALCHDIIANALTLSIYCTYGATFSVISKLWLQNTIFRYYSTCFLY